MKHLRSRSIPAVRKELAAFVILYNLIRQTMLVSARLQHVEVNRISFIDAATGSCAANPARNRVTWWSIRCDIARPSLDSSRTIAATSAVSHTPEPCWNAPPMRWRYES